MGIGVELLSAKGELVVELHGAARGDLSGEIGGDDFGEGGQDFTLSHRGDAAAEPVPTVSGAGGLAAWPGGTAL
jgi:hypothetical protein